MNPEQENEPNVTEQDWKELHEAASQPTLTKEDEEALKKAAMESGSETEQHQ